MSTPKTAIEAALRVRETDIRLRAIIDSTVAEVMQDNSEMVDGRPLRKRDLHHLLTEAVTLALVRTYESDAELKMLRTERDHYRKIAEETLSLSPPRPIIITQDQQG